MVTVTERIQWHGTFFTPSTANEVFWLNLHYTGTYKFMNQELWILEWMILHSISRDKVIRDHFHIISPLSKNEF